jgi:polyferredoxin
MGAAVRSFRARRRSVATWTVLAGLLVIGAAFNGSSFLDFANNISSLIMALLAFGAVACYAAALFLVAVSRPQVSPAPGTGTGSFL